MITCGLNEGSQHKPFSLFVSVYVYASVCDFVCVALLLPFVLGLWLSILVLFCFFLCFFRIVFSDFIFGGCFFWFGCSLLSLFFLLFLIFLFLIIFSIFFLSFFPSLPPSLFLFLPLLLSDVADKVLVLWPGVRPEPLRWERRVQDTGPPETSWPHVIANGESSPRDLHLNAKTQLHSATSKLQCWTP